MLVDRRSEQKSCIVNKGKRIRSHSYSPTTSTEQRRALLLKEDTQKRNGVLLWRLYFCTTCHFCPPIGRGGLFTNNKASTVTQWTVDAFQTDLRLLNLAARACYPAMPIFEREKSPISSCKAAANLLSW